MKSLLALLSLLSVGLFVLPAHAGLDACGNIDVSAQANCELDATGGCTARCSNVSFDAACSGQLEATCDAQCPELPSVTCSGSCQADCEASCTNNPDFSCSANCQATCDGNCDAHCSTAANKTECVAQCKGTCSGSCTAKCNGSPVDCTGKCQASCNGSCHVDKTIACNVQCQSQGFVQCKADLKGQCKVQCTQPEGAIFCDTTYVDRGNNAQQCVAALEGWLESHVVANASASCSGNTCTADASATCKCSVPGRQRESSGAPWVLSLGAVVAVAAAARRGRRTP